ncbi:hypothetical protein CEQ90_05595 [Lewinellaceae bacterium SD302]|nr:hypothetical protein CEQ90_05595 [Lewinellaceae bacterium SD302]
MKPIITIIFLFILELLSAQGTLPDTLELTALQELASEQALSVWNAEREAELATLDLDILKANLLPRLDLSANIPDYFSSFRETTQPDGTIAFQPVTINNSSVQLTARQQIAATGGQLFLSSNLQRFDDFENDRQNYNGVPLRFGINQPILAFNSLKWRKRVLPALQKETAAQLSTARANAVSDVTTLFFNLLFAQQNREIALDNQEASQRLYDIAGERYELGKINRGDLVQIELELTAAGQNVLRAERSLVAATVSIYNFLGYVYNGGSLAAARPPIPPVISTDRASLIKEMLVARPEFITATRQKLEAQRELERSKRDFGPQLSLQASIGLVRSDPELSPIYADPQNEQIVSLQVNVPILDWGERKAVVRQAETQLQYAERINERNLLSLTARADLLLQQYNELSEELQLTRRISELAEERFGISRESYLLGSIPLTELTLAQQNRDQLARTYLSTLGAYWEVWAELQALTP